MEMVKTTTAPGRAAEQNKAGPGTRKMPIPLVVAGTSAMAGVFLISLFFPQNVKNIGSFGPGALVAEWGITPPLPEPVILFANAHVKVQGKARGVKIAGIGSLPEILDQLPNRLSIPEAGRIYNRILAASLL